MNSLQPNAPVLDPVVNYQTVAYSDTGLAEYKITQVTDLSVWAVQDKLSSSLRYRNIKVLLFPVTRQKEESHSLEISGNEDLLATALSAEEAKKEIFSQLLDLLDKNNEGHFNLIGPLYPIESLSPIKKDKNFLHIESLLESLSPIKKDKDFLHYILKDQTISIKTPLNDKSSS